MICPRDEIIWDLGWALNPMAGVPMGERKGDRDEVGREGQREKERKIKHRYLTLRKNNSKQITLKCKIQNFQVPRRYREKNLDDDLSDIVQ